MRPHHFVLLGTLVGCTNTVGSPGVLKVIDAKPAAVTLKPGETQQLTFVAADANHDELPVTVQWKSDQPSVATVDPASGLVTAVNEGLATVTATSGSVTSAGVGVTVHAPVSTVVLSPNPDTIPIGQTGSLGVVLKDAHGDTLNGRTVAWTTSDSTVASINVQSGLITAKSPGAVTITATSEGRDTTATVNVAVAWANVFAGSTHACAVTTTNIGYCWGFGANGELGTGAAAPQVCFENAPCSTVPVAVAPPSGSTTPLRFQEIRPGEYMSCGLTLDAQLYCWGYGFGSGPPVPVALTGLSGTIKVLSVGLNNACVTTTTSTTYCLGSDNAGALGVPLASAPSTPNVLVQVGAMVGFQAIAPDLAVGSNFACASVYLGSSYCWGSNQYGQLGIGAAAGSTCTVGSATIDCTFAPIAVAAPKQFDQISAGDTHACGVAGGTTYCWGANETGELGDGGTTNANQPAAVQGSFSYVSAGGQVTCALGAMGAPYCWGGSPASSKSPVGISGSPSLTTISAGGQFACGISSGGAAYCAGSNIIGELGNGTYSATSTTTFGRVLAPAR